MTKANKTVENVLKRVEDTMFTAKLGLDNVQSKDPKTRLAEIRNVVVFGRAVTNALQNLRGLVPDFDKWYDAHRKEMESDPLAKLFYRLRSEILKEGKLNISSSVRLSGNPMLLLQRYAKPPHAKSFFIGDAIGGSGWVVEMDDGSTEHYYVELPGEIPGLDLDINIHFADSPEQLKHLPVPEVCQLYYEYLERMVGEAKRKFGGRH